MITQDHVWMWTLAGMGIVTLAFAFVIINAGKPSDASQVRKRAYAIRRWWFLALALLGVGVTYASLNPFPIADQHAYLPRRSRSPPASRARMPPPSLTRPFIPSLRCCASSLPKSL